MRARVLVVFVAASCATPTSQARFSATTYEALVTSADRTPEDVALDPGRKPALFLAAIGLTQGEQVGELFAGGGYTTELLARAVGPSGRVYGQNPKWVLERFAAKPWADRLARPINQNVVRVDRELDAPFPPELAGTLDVVVTNANYHDAIWQKVDTAKMNAGVLAALKHGGRYVISDSSAKAGAGDEVSEQLHRVEEARVRREVEAAGFVFERSSDVLRNPTDTRDWNASPRAAGEKRGLSDRFILVFTRP